MRLGGGDNRVRRGKVAKMLIKVVGVVAIIAFFSAFYCWGFWDVMGAMKRVPVGIVNLDEGACIGDKTMNLGADIVEAAQESEDATFVSLDKGAMDNGIEGSGYLIVFEIPSDFSQRVASGQNGLPSVADLTILKNERYNFIYSQFASRITSALETSIYQQIAKAYTVGAYEGLFSARDGLSDAAASMQEVEGGCVGFGRRSCFRCCWCPDGNRRRFIVGVGVRCSGLGHRFRRGCPGCRIFWSKPVEKRFLSIELRAFVAVLGAIRRRGSAVRRPSWSGNAFRQARFRWRCGGRPCFGSRRGKAVLPGRSSRSCRRRFVRRARCGRVDGSRRRRARSGCGRREPAGCWACRGV